MKLTDLLFFWKHKQCPSPPEPELEPASNEPEVPQNSTIILEEINQSEIEGHPEMVFKTKEQIYMGEDGQKCKICTTKNPQAAGCWHNLKSPNDVGFISHISKLPVCKICEQEYYRLREQTRNEKCVCRHLVAPHELTYLEGKGFVCKECKKKEKAITPKKIGKWLWSAIKPLITDAPEQKIEGTNDYIQLSPTRGLPSFLYDPRTRPGYGSQNSDAHELDRTRSDRQDDH